MAITIQNLFSRLAKNLKIKLNQNDIISARKWYRETALNVNRVSSSEIFHNKANQFTNQVTPKDIGSMMMFFYDPKHKEKLPFYDTFPLIFPIEIYKDGFLGINLHYLAPLHRAKLMDSLYGLLNNKKINDNTRLNLSYSMLKGISGVSLFSPCVKRYLFSHVQSKFMVVPPTQWDIVLMLPTERFKKSNKEKVWRNSMQKV